MSVLCRTLVRCLDTLTAWTVDKQEVSFLVIYDRKCERINFPAIFQSYHDICFPETGFFDT